MDLRYLKSIRFDDVLCGGRTRMMNKIGKIACWFLACTASSVDCAIHDVEHWKFAQFGVGVWKL